MKASSEAYSGPLYRLTVWPAVATVAPPALGIARAAIDELIELATKKIPAYTVKSLRDRSVVQSQLGQAEAKLGAARAYLHDVFDRAYAEAVNGKSITMEFKCKAQLASTHAILAAAEAVDLVHAAVGVSGIRREYHFEKYFRDVHVLTQHAFASASRLESVGQILMGSSRSGPSLRSSTSLSNSISFNEFACWIGFVGHPEVSFTKSAPHRSGLLNAIVCLSISNPVPSPNRQVRILAGVGFSTGGLRVIRDLSHPLQYRIGQIVCRHRTATRRIVNLGISRPCGYFPSTP
jgi:hypothetical protein